MREARRGSFRARGFDRRRQQRQIIEMRFRPEIVSPCPIGDRLSSAMDRGICRHCDKRVHDLDEMSVAARHRLFATSAGDLCVKYRAPASASLAAAALAAAIVPATAAAQPGDSPLPAAETQEFEEYIVVGGARRLTADEMRQLRLEDAWEAEREGRKLRKEKWLRARSRTSADRQSSP